MTKLKSEVLDAIENRIVEYGYIEYVESHDKKIVASFRSHEEFLSKLIDKFGDMEYDPGYGRQYVYGFIVFTDGTWMERGEYDGSEWWRHVVKPSNNLPEDI